MSEYSKKYKLQIIGGLALIPLEIQADFFRSNDRGYYEFRKNGSKYSVDDSSILLAAYPVINTIISEIIINKDE